MRSIRLAEKYSPVLKTKKFTQDIDDKSN